ncbi:IS3 family transposase [Mechercharimyces sp. CAU 1602]|uniref:IS3 family transposase n=1 Tax=Mechercharimyces sp. CAU 1602 TaxID=2973933 RepID=UPI0021616AC3|nr:IS3 family transposase [Mechercharimyces sp. CAU 1602]MCS1350227.1 IS3 family transposase [Mechercharimyces sp. CAU 1602]
MIQEEGNSVAESQYASHEYQDRLQQYGMHGSMSRKGNCYDNACIESCHSIIKRELVYLSTFLTRKQAERSVFEYIECFYNKKRVRSYIDYCTLCEYEQLYYESLSPAA